MANPQTKSARAIETTYAKWREAVESGKSRQEAAHAVGYKSWSSLRDLFKTRGLDADFGTPRSRVVSKSDVPAPIACVDDILERRRREYARRVAHEQARKMVDIGIEDDVGIIGLLVHGDEHLDNPGTDISAVERSVRLVQETPGLYAASMGDVTDAWVGRLQHLYSESTTTLGEAIALCEWYINALGEKFLFAVGGNHNAAWWGDNDPLINLMRSNGTLYLDNEIRVALNINDAPPVTIYARHGWPGRSMWNAGHGTQRAAQMGATDDILLGGHTHVSAYGLVRQQGRDAVTHCIQVASFKVHDQYARDLGLRDGHISPAVLLVLDPRATGPGRVLVFHDIEQGARVLTAMRDCAVK